VRAGVAAPVSATPPYPTDASYCYATANEPELGLSAPAGSDDERLAELRRRFGDWHEPIPMLLAAAEGEPVLRHDIHELPNLST